MMGEFFQGRRKCSFSGRRNLLHFPLATHSTDTSPSGEPMSICFLTEVTFPSLPSPQLSYFVPEGQVLGLTLLLLVASWKKKRFQQVGSRQQNESNLLPSQSSRLEAVLYFTQGLKGQNCVSDPSLHLLRLASQRNAMLREAHVHTPQLSDCRFLFKIILLDINPRIRLRSLCPFNGWL